MKFELRYHSETKVVDTAYSPALTKHDCVFSLT